MCYWAHLRRGRVNGPKSYCVRCRFRRQSVRVAGACGKFHPWAATPHGSVETASAPICKSQTGYLHGHVFKPDLAIFPGISPFYSTTWAVLPDLAEKSGTCIDAT